MKKKIVCLFVLFSFLFSNALIAEAIDVPKTPNNQISYKKKKWQPWIVVIATILVATTGLIVVSKNKGKKAN